MNLQDHIDRSFDSQLSKSEWDALQQAVINDPGLRSAPPRGSVLRRGS